MSTAVCRHCSSAGHFVRDCPKIVCHACGGSGHFRNDCPTTTSSSNGAPMHQQRKRSRSRDSFDQRGAGHQCFACGAIGHNRSQCPVHCSNCGQNGHVISRCPRRDLSDTCFHCAEEGHLSNQCPYRSETNRRLCYQCHQPGHLASRCPQIVRCNQCGELGHVQSRCPTSTCAACHEVGHLVSSCPLNQPQQRYSGTDSPPADLRSSSPGSLRSEDNQGRNQPQLQPPLDVGGKGGPSPSSAVGSTATTAAPVLLANASVPAFEPSASSADRKGRVAVILDGAYFERCIAGFHRKDVPQFLKCKELLKYTLDHIGNIFDMQPIAYWFDTDPNSFASFIESTTSNPVQRDTILKDSEVRKRWLLDFMNGGKELSNVVAKLVGGMKRQRGFTQEGMGHVWVQTGVDVSIATCVIECFQDRRQYQQVVLVSGDSDLYPCVHYCNQSRRGLPPDIPPVRVCGTSGSISRVFGQHQDLSDFLPRILLDEPVHTENGRKTPFSVAGFFAEAWKA